MNPKVSIILTTHGKAPYLKQAIGSVLAQTFEDWELIVAADKPILTDRPYSALQFDNGEIQDDRFKNVNFYVPEGIECRFASTINQAFKFCKGEYITYLCHDDLYLPWRLGEMLKYKACNVVFGLQKLLDHTPTGLNLDGDIRKGNPDQPAGTVDHSSVMHRRECFEKAGGWDENAPMRFGDAYFWARLQAAGYKFHCIPEVLDVHRFNRESVTWKIDHPQADYTSFDDLGNKRTINNAVDAGWSAIEK